MAQAPKPNEAAVSLWKRKVEAVAQEYQMTRRQAEVFSYLAKGRTSAYIEKALYISHATAKTHIYTIYRKMGIHSQQELIDIVDSKYV
jgi:DNA-binding NarL/FixJ family response regulator